MSVLMVANCSEHNSSTQSLSVKISYLKPFQGELDASTTNVVPDNYELSDIICFEDLCCLQAMYELLLPKTLSCLARSDMFE